MDEALEPEEVADLFLRTLFEPDDVVELRAKRGKDGPLRQTWIKAPYGPAIARAQLLNEAGFNIYVGANPRIRQGGASDKDVAIARYVFADFDITGITLGMAQRLVHDAGYPEPSIWVHSGRGIHPWWRLDEPCRDMASWRRRQLGIIARLGTDSQVQNPSRVMRVPGFYNRNYPHSPPSILLAFS